MKQAIFHPADARYAGDPRPLEFMKTPRRGVSQKLGFNHDAGPVLLRVPGRGLHHPRSAGSPADPPPRRRTSPGAFTTRGLGGPCGQEAPARPSPKPTRKRVGFGLSPAPRPLTTRPPLRRLRAAPSPVSLSPHPPPAFPGADHARPGRRRDGRDAGLRGQAVRPQEHRRRVLVHLPGVAEPVRRHRAADLQAPPQAPRRRGRGSPPRRRRCRRSRVEGRDGADGRRGPPLLLAEPGTTPPTSPAGG